MHAEYVKHHHICTLHKQSMEQVFHPFSGKSDSRTGTSDTIFPFSTVNCSAFRKGRQATYTDASAGIVVGKSKALSSRTFFHSGIHNSNQQKALALLFWRDPWATEPIWCFCGIAGRRVILCLFSSACSSSHMQPWYGWACSGSWDVLCLSSTHPKSLHFTPRSFLYQVGGKILYPNISFLHIINWILNGSQGQIGLFLSWHLSL